MISSVFACKIREAIISVLTERSLNRALAGKELHARWSRAAAAIPDHRDSLKFVQEVARFVTSRFFGKKSLGGLKSRLVGNTAHLYYSPLSLSDCSSTRTGISEPRPIRGGVCPSLSLIGLDHDMSLMCVCCWTTGRLSESQRLFFPSRTAGRTSATSDLFLVAPLRN